MTGVTLGQHLLDVLRKSHLTGNAPQLSIPANKLGGTFGTEHKGRAKCFNAKVSDVSQPTTTFDLSLSESAGSRLPHRPVRHLL